MKDGAKILNVHMIVTSLIFYSVVVGIVFEPILVGKHTEELLYLVGKFQHTLLFGIFIGLPTAFALTLMFLKTLFPLPYIFLYWFKRVSNSTRGSIAWGSCLTAFAVLLIIADECFFYLPSNIMREYLSLWDSKTGIPMFAFAVFSIVIIPHFLLHLTYPTLKQISFYRVYSILFWLQVSAYSLAIVAGVLS